MSDYSDAPAAVVDRLRPICEALPEIHEEPAWAGTRWRVRTRTFAHVLTVESERGERVILTFRADGEERDVLASMGHPFFVLGWGRDAMGLVIDDDTDWDEVTELVTDSFCLLAPKKLARLVDRPEPIA